MRIKLSILLMVLFCGAARGQTIQPPLLSCSWRSVDYTGTPPGGLMPFKADGSWQLITQVPVCDGGISPPQNVPVYIVAASLSHLILQNGNGSEWAMIGHSGPNGDSLTPFVIGNGTQTISFPKGQQPLLSPGEFIDSHAQANADVVHSVIVTIWYVKAQ